MATTGKGGDGKLLETLPQKLSDDTSAEPPSCAGDKDRLQVCLAGHAQPDGAQLFANRAGEVRRTTSCVGAPPDLEPPRPAAGLPLLHFIVDCS